ncbi:sigma factor-like helix-turn-helix DNA-binding protein [Actinokineospora auranticolor]|uniref:DNA-directed RNA polymerase specialized sigma24 family protein n=1 Tax=Actinokineospora auranticolor TaxID=155976 RepID=A0A2S6GB94_9PSEU|nr:sigma factor-like helix-turn-helix DNA-binding protein [Actinokineospora auranticolor]PPK60683.1 DNA-directed RNA polymerase specialized sigma24 family protein [Actinokineospora auranticolor]
MTDPTPPPAARPGVEELIENSSLGTPGARTLRARTPERVADAITERAAALAATTRPPSGSMRRATRLAPLTDTDVLALREAAANPGRSAMRDPDREQQPRNLVAAVIDGDTDAPRQLADLLHPAIVRYCHVRARSTPALANQAANQARAALQGSMPDLLKGLSISFSLLALVRGVADRKLTELRSSHQTADAADTSSTLADDGLEDGAREGGLIDEMAAAVLSGLTPRQYEVLQLRVVIGFTADETATLFGTTVAAIRVAQHRALNALRAKLGTRATTPEPDKPTVANQRPADSSPAPEDTPPAAIANRYDMGVSPSSQWRAVAEQAIAIASSAEQPVVQYVDNPYMDNPSGGARAGKT